jgi:DMSO/TMAO reductase YedYZ molybdopterin-dependent catalytic subunit
MSQESSASLDRRQWMLASASAAAAMPLLATSASADDPPRPAPSPLIVRQSTPENLETVFANLDSFVTPTPSFYVRSHFAVPSLDEKTFRLRIEGEVDRPITLTLDEIRRLGERTVTVLLECAGNGRVFLNPQAAGLLWDYGGVGTAEWTGVPLSAVLERAGLKKTAVEAILYGADTGEIKAMPNPFQTPGPVHFARSMPIAKAQRDALLAYKMNGAELTPAHGFPLRAIVPGWYGMASIKWLDRIVVTDRPFNGYFQTLEYAYFERRHGEPVLMPVTELQVKSTIARPARGETIQAGAACRIRGFAWTSDSEITRVEVSTDGGRSWNNAQLAEQNVQNAWRMWHYVWQNPTAGRHTLMCRAHDRRGRVQPMERDPDRRNGMISHVLPQEVIAR